MTSHQIDTQATLRALRAAGETSTPVSYRLTAAGAAAVGLVPHLGDVVWDGDGCAASIEDVGPDAIECVWADGHRSIIDIDELEPTTNRGNGRPYQVWEIHP